MVTIRWICLGFAGMIVAARRPGVERKIGELVVQEFGQRGRPVAIGLHGMAEALLTEWDDAAEALADDLGFNVYLPNLHKSDYMHRSLPVLTAALVNLLSIVGAPAGRIPLLMGKSMGGNQAAKIATMREVVNVEHVILVAPGSVDTRIECPAALFWAKDDASFKRAESTLSQLAHKDLYHVANKGGHRILNSYTSVIKNLVGETWGFKPGARRGPTVQGTNMASADGSVPLQTLREPTPNDVIPAWFYFVLALSAVPCIYLLLQLSKVWCRVSLEPKKCGVSGQGDPQVFGSVE